MRNRRFTKAITLLSGGLDSAVATALTMPDFDIALALTFDYGQKSSAREIRAARSLCDLWKIEHETIHIPWLKKETKTALVATDKAVPKLSPNDLDGDVKHLAQAVWVPGRNALFVSIAASIAEARGYGAIIAGFNVEEAATFKDNSAEFVDAANELLKFSSRQAIQLISPTVKMTKLEIAKRSVSLKIPVEYLWCCYEGNDRPCGRCESCARSIRAFKAASLWHAIEKRFQ